MASSSSHVISASARIHAPAERIYAIIADYRDGHPHILPKQFSGVAVERGGFGAGTSVRYQFRAFGRVETIWADIAEPVPGRVLVESIVKPRPAVTTFTVTPGATGQDADVVISTELASKPGLLGGLERFLTRRLLQPLYAEELALLAHRAEAQSAGTHFPTEVAGLPASVDTEVLALADGDTAQLRIAPVAKRIGDATVRMLAYNGSIPGPTLKVPQGSELLVNVVNDGDLAATVHWHGVRVENRYDGTHQTQAPMEIGEDFTYRVRFPDPGVYWYHPHVREDYGQEMGLYGNILVVPADADYWPPVNREVLLTLDDILLEHGKVAPFSRSETTHVAMGRFGNVPLIGGSSNLEMTAHLGEVVRFYLTNTANTRVFNVQLQGARMKIVGGDSGRCEQEEFVTEVLLAPSERAVVDVLFDQAGHVTLEHHTPDRCYRLAAITVTEDQATPSLSQQYEVLRRNPDMVAQRQRVARYLNAPADKTLAFVAEMDMGGPVGDGAIVYTCPMHPEVTSETADRCPECGMKLVPSDLVGQPTAGHGTNHERPMYGHDNEGGAEATDGIEWEDDMVAINRITTPANMRWKLVDRTTGAENHAIDWRFQVGDLVKIRLINEMDSDHPMHHPFHIHGAGRFLILCRDGVVEHNLVWKDTVLLRTGQTIDILLDISNPGVWMAHCHIAEHHESGMMFSFTVSPRPEQAE